MQLEYQFPDKESIYAQLQSRDDMKYLDELNILSNVASYFEDKIIKERMLEMSVTYALMIAEKNTGNTIEQETMKYSILLQTYLRCIARMRFSEANDK